MLIVTLTGVKRTALIVAAVLAGITAVAIAGFGQSSDEGTWPADLPSSSAEMTSLRGKLISELWQTGSIPDQLPSIGQPLPVGTFLAPPDFLSAVQPEYRALTVPLRFGLTSRVILYEPKKPNKEPCALIYSSGHSSLLEGNGYLPITAGLQEGCFVAGIQMPGLGMNANQRATRADGTIIDVTPRVVLHNEYYFLDTDDRTAMDIFVEPSVVVTNWLIQQNPSVKIYAAGLSGGAWTTTLASAVDARIANSLSLGGPPATMSADNCRDDYEQCHSTFYSRVSPLQIDALAAAGLGRQHVQRFNKNDPCCHRLDSVPPWALEAAASAASTGGRFSVQISDSSEHAWTDDSVKVLDEWMAR